MEVFVFAIVIGIIAYAIKKLRRNETAVRKVPNISAKAIKKHTAKMVQSRKIGWPVIVLPKDQDYLEYLTEKNWPLCRTKADKIDCLRRLYNLEMRAFQRGWFEVAAGSIPKEIREVMGKELRARKPESLEKAKAEGVSKFGDDYAESWELVEMAIRDFPDVANAWRDGNETMTRMMQLPRDKRYKEYDGMTKEEYTAKRRGDLLGYGRKTIEDIISEG